MHLLIFHACLLAPLAAVSAMKNFFAIWQIGFSLGYFSPSDMFSASTFLPLTLPSVPEILPPEGNFFDDFPPGLRLRQRVDLRLPGQIDSSYGAQWNSVC